MFYHKYPSSSKSEGVNNMNKYDLPEIKFPAFLVAVFLIFVLCACLGTYGIALFVVVTGFSMLIVGISTILYFAYEFFRSED
jgi:uncharacterized protein YybS (DUF2232 family)